MADQHIHADKKSECINDFIEKVSSANHLPGYTYTHTNGQSSQESKLEVHSHGGSEVVSEQVFSIMATRMYTLY
jgi:hypothetical protein